jgi:hypothetical protein
MTYLGCPRTLGYRLHLLAAGIGLEKGTSCVLCLPPKNLNARQVRHPTRCRDGNDRRFDAGWLMGTTCCLDGRHFSFKISDGTARMAVDGKPGINRHSNFDFRS